VYYFFWALTELQERSWPEYKIDNAPIKFVTYRTSLQFYDFDRATPSEFRVYVQITDSIKKEFKTICKDEWLRLLQDEKTDWAANPILYDIYEKEAIKFRIQPNRLDWVNRHKAKEIEYWRSFFETTIL
jgi:hypothetical protein